MREPAEERWREGGWHRPRERSARRPEGIWDCGRSVHSALLSLFLSTTDSDTPIAKTYAATEDTSICLKTTPPLPVSFSRPVRGCSPTHPDSIRAPLPSKICPLSPPKRKRIVIFCSSYHSCGLSVCFLTCTVYFLFIFDL